MQEWGSFPGPETGLTLRNELSEETHVLTKQEILLGKGTRVESSRVREPRRTALPHGLQSRVLWGWDWFLSCLWPNCSDSGSFLLVHTLLSQDGCQRGGFWEMVGHVTSPFDLSRTFPIGGGLLVPCSLAGPPVLNNSCKWLLWCAWPRWAVSISVLPLTESTS